jgi:hypothetical protein
MARLALRGGRKEREGKKEKGELRGQRNERRRETEEVRRRSGVGEVAPKYLRNISGIAPE